MFGWNKSVEVRRPVTLLGPLPVLPSDWSLCVYAAPLLLATFFNLKPFGPLNMCSALLSNDLHLPLH